MSAIPSDTPLRGYVVAGANWYSVVYAPAPPMFTAALPESESKMEAATPADAPAPAVGAGLKFKSARRRIEICWQWASKGTCTFGKGCRFVHEIARGQEGPDAIPTAPTDPAVPRHFKRHTELEALPGKFKTEICAQWLSKGTCSYGKNCTFAHGRGEQRISYVPLQYKTAPCKSWELNGKCEFKANCHWRHSGEEASPAIVKHFTKHNGIPKLAILKPTSLPLPLPES